MRARQREKRARCAQLGLREKLRRDLEGAVAGMERTGEESGAGGMSEAKGRAARKGSGGRGDEEVASGEGASSESEPRRGSRADRDEKRDFTPGRTESVERYVGAFETVERYVGAGDGGR